MMGLGSVFQYSPTPKTLVSFQWPPLPNSFQGGEGEQQAPTPAAEREYLKPKKNVQHYESNTALCKVSTKNGFYIVRCCVKGFLLEVNQQLIKKPELLNLSADREGYIAMIKPKPADWFKAKASLVSLH